MGGTEGLRRQTLGLSNNQPPNYAQLAHHFQPREVPDLTPDEQRRGPFYESIDPAHGAFYGKVFDAKGRPFAPRVSALREARAQAVDRVTHVVVGAEFERAGEAGRGAGG